MIVATGSRVRTLTTAPVAGTRLARSWVRAVWDFLVLRRDVRRAGSLLRERLGQQRLEDLFRHMGRVAGQADLTWGATSGLIARAEQLSRPKYRIPFDRLLQLVTRAATMRALLPIADHA